MESTTAVGSRTEASRDALAYGGLTVATLGWASAFIAGKVVLEEMTPLVASAWRSGIALVLLLPFAFRNLRGIRLRPLVLPLAVLVIGGGIAYPWCFLNSLQHTTATNSSLLIALNPVFTVLAAPLIGEHLTRRRLGGILLSLTGATIVITQGELRRLLDLSLNVGDLFALASAVIWAVFNLTSRLALAQLSPAPINCLVYGVGTAALLLLGLPEHPLQQLLDASAAAITGLLVMAVLASVLAAQLFLLGLRAIGVSRAVVFIYLVPVLTALLSALMLDESLTLPQVAGGTAVLSGVYLTSRQS